jgi:hypothetical protein
MTHHHTCYILPAKKYAIKTIKDRAFELNSNYFIKATASSNPLMIQLKNEYIRGFSSRAFTKATPLCASKDNIKDFYIDDLSQEDLALFKFEMSNIEP